MRLFLLYLLLAATNISFGQFALIDDKDGYVNVRSSAENKKNVFDTLKNRHIVWCFEPEGNWINIDYEKKGKSITGTGYVYKDRVKYLDSFDSIPIHKLEKQQVTLKRDSLTITISQEDFVVKKNVLKYETSDNAKYVSTINGKPVWGADGNIPKRQYKAIKIQIGKRSVSIPKTALENLFEPNLDYSECYYDIQRDILYLSSMNSDGAGGYVVLWVIEKGKYQNKIVTTPF